MRRCCYFILVLIVVSCAQPKPVVDNFGLSAPTTWKDNKAAAISLTFDDATINQFRKALPIMDSLGFKGTFFINTADIPDSKFPPRYFGKPLELVVDESNTPTNENNLFERASALRFLNIEEGVTAHNAAGALYEQGKYNEAYKVIDEAYAHAFKVKDIREFRPVLLSGEVITWPELKQYAERGHEFGNHTISHPRLAVLTEENLLYELEKGKEEIRLQLGEKHTFSAECPFGTEDLRVMSYAHKIHPALRNRMPAPYLEELNRWSEKLPYECTRDYVQWQRGPLQKTSLEVMKSWVDTLLVHQNVWLVLTFHGVDGIGWEAKPSSELRSYFEYMKKHEDQVWVCTFGDATRYMRERMESTVNSLIEDEKIEVEVSHKLDTAMYNVPLTIKTYLRDDWHKIDVLFQGKRISFKEGSDKDGKFVMYEFLPGDGKVVILKKG